MARTVAIVPHTHWDREWYSPFQVFRLRLVDLLDEFLPRMEADPAYARFLLDGQMAVVDDYLAVRPEAEETLRRLTGSGRLSMGPWYILMDEFLVSGETIIRDLQMGFDRAAAFGGAMPVGYLPDMFGHIAQMPQILRLAGLDHTVVWRGVPSVIDRSAFWWEAPDGSRVRAEYLFGGYGNGASIPDDAKALLRRIAAHERELGDALLGEGILFMNGTDHEVPQPWLGRVVAEANELQDDYRLVVTSLPEYLETAPTEGLQTWRGELRSGARANLLMGVASNRVDVKQAAARAERTLERLAEPLSGLFLPADRWPASLLDIAWKEVVRNCAHDSICACSDDEVVDAVLHRYAEARQVGEGLAARAITALADSLSEQGAVIVNPSARTRAGLVELTIPGDGPVEGAQLLHATRNRFAGELVIDGATLPSLIGGIRTQQLDDDTYINAVDVEEGDDGISIVLHADTRLRDTILIEEIKNDVLDRVQGRPDVAVRLRVDMPPTRRILTWVDAVPGYGWTMWRPEVPAVEPVLVDGHTASNGLTSLSVDERDGTFALDGHAGLGRLVDGGDYGDTYNYSPPDEDVVVDTPDRVEVAVLEEGPMRARFGITAGYTWPTHIEGRPRTRVGAQPIDVVTEVELRAGERFARVSVSLDNRCGDHRLRTHFPLPVAATVSRAECAFAIVERGLTAEGGPNEYGLPTFPCRRFVSAGGLTVAHEGLLEYELIRRAGGAQDEGATADELALTLLRATGLLSRVDMAYRPLPAGPPLRTDGSQLRKPMTLRYAVQIGDIGDDIDPYALVDDAFLPLMVEQAPGGGTVAPEGSALSVRGAEVSAVQRQAGTLEVRVFNPRGTATTVELDGRTGWLVDLRGRTLEPFEGGFELGPWQIATARLD
jgi:alpha-mannosidase